MELDDVIKEKLIEMELDPEKIKENLMKYLRSIEQLIQEKDSYWKQVLSDIENTKYTVKSVADELKISRTTFYSYDNLLQKYVQHSIEKSKKRNPYNVIQNLEESHKLINSRIKLMEQRDVDVLLLENENELLRNQLKEKNKEVENLKEELIGIGKKNSAYNNRKDSKNKSPFLS